VTRRIEFDAAHRVAGHESKCGTIHGHRYVAEITAQASDLDNLGRVIDFSVLKEKVGGWIDTHWDHTSIIYHGSLKSSTCFFYYDDEPTLALLQQAPAWKHVWVAPWNPTAENMAHHLLHVICPMVLDGTGVKVVKVRLYETPNCWADCELKDHL